MKLEKLKLYKGPYSQYFIFSVAYEWAQKARVFANPHALTLPSSKNQSFKLILKNRSK
jgi:hypothetical protein